MFRHHARKLVVALALLAVAGSSMLPAASPAEATMFLPDLVITAAISQPLDPDASNHVYTIKNRGSFEATNVKLGTMIWTEHKKSHHTVGRPGNLAQINTIQPGQTVTVMFPCIPSPANSDFRCVGTSLIADPMEGDMSDSNNKARFGPYLAPGF